MLVAMWCGSFGDVTKEGIQAPPQIGPHVVIRCTRRGAIIEINEVESGVYPPSIPGNIEWERFDSALKKVFSIPVDAVQKEKARVRVAREKTRRKKSA